MSTAHAKGVDLADRVGGGVAPAVLPHHRTYGSRIRRFLPANAGVKFVFRQQSAQSFISTAVAIRVTDSYNVLPRAPRRDIYSNLLEKLLPIHSRQVQPFTIRSHGYYGLC